jgi:hypothetical protein
VGGIGYTVLAWSHDGERWTRDREPFLPRNPRPGSWDHAMTWGDDQLVIGDETFIYYGGYARGHKIERFTERQIGLARMPRDRYVAREAGPTEGQLQTRLVTLPAAPMTVNARVPGELRVRVVRPTGEPVRGFDWNDCAPVRGDGVALPVRWTGDVQGVAGKPVRLEFRLREGRLFGFESGG